MAGQAPDLCADHRQNPTAIPGHQDAEMLKWNRADSAVLIVFRIMVFN
jgi:hypothetical protein